MDVMLHLFTELYENENEPLRATGFFGVLVPSLAGRDLLAPDFSADDFQADFARAVRDALELSDAYALAESVAFFFVTEPNDVETAYTVGDPYDCLDLAFERRLRANEKDVEPGAHPQRKQRRVDAVLAMRNACTSSYHFGRDSGDFCECFRSTLDVERMFQALDGDAGGPAGRLFDNRRLMQSECALKNRFGFKNAFQRGEVRDLTLRCLLRRDPLRGDAWALDLSRGVCFFVHGRDVSRECFSVCRFPDVRLTQHDPPAPDRDLRDAISRMGFDAFVVPGDKGDFAVLREQMTPSVARVDAEARAAAGPGAAREARERWRRATANVFKNKFATSGRVAASFKGLVAYWESLVEGLGFIKLHALPSMRYADLDAQQSLLLYLWELVEDESTYSQHSHAVRLLINCRWACAKHLASQHKPPHEALTGEPGSGKSRLLEMQQAFLPSDFYKCMSSWSDKAMLTDKDPETGEVNRELNFSQTNIFMDELNGDDFGYSGEGKNKDKSFGEGNQRVTLAKQMWAPANRQMTWIRQVRKLDKYGNQIQCTETGSATVEACIFGNMNGKKTNVNPAFNRRIAFTNVNKRTRPDGQDFEETKRKEKYARMLAPAREALKDNARVQYTVGLARFVGTMREAPPLTTFELLVEPFQAAALRYTDTPHFSERIDDVRRRVQLFTDMYACGATLQSRAAARVRRAAEAGDGFARYTFDELIEAHADVEAAAVPGERTCLALLGSLEEVCFPSLHRYLLEALCAAFRDAVRAAFEDDDGEPHLDLGVREHRSLKETSRECAARALTSAALPYFRTKTNGFDIKEPEFQVEGAVEELFERVTGPPQGRHAVLRLVEDEGGVRVMLSKYRLRYLHVGVHTAAEACLHAGSPLGKQLLLAPYRKEVPLPGFEDLGLKTLAFAPQLPMFLEVGEHAAGCAREPCTCFRARPAWRRQFRGVRLKTLPGAVASVPPPRPRGAYPGILDDECFAEHHALQTFLDPECAETRARFHPGLARLWHEGETPDIDRAVWPAPEDVAF